MKLITKACKPSLEFARYAMQFMSEGTPDPEIMTTVKM